MQRHHAWLLAAAFAIFSSTAQAENVIIVKAGTYSLSETTQTLDTDWPTSVVALEKDGTLYGIEYEWRFRNGFSIGGEFAHSEHSYVETTTFPSTVARGDLIQETLTFNGKKYFEVTDWFFPYVGIGVGIAGAILEETSGYERSYGGLAVQGMGGAEFRFGRFGLLGGVKWVSAEVDDGWDDTLDISGVSYLGGASVHF